MLSVDRMKIYDHTYTHITQTTTIPTTTTTSNTTTTTTGLEIDDHKKRTDDYHNMLSTKQEEVDRLKFHLETAYSKKAEKGSLDSTVLDELQQKYNRDVGKCDVI